MHEFTTVLQTDEKLLWRGQPVPRKLFNSLDLLVVPFSVVVTLFIGVVNYFTFTREKAWASPDAPVIFLFVDVLFVLVALYLLVGRLAYRYWRLQNSRYALTDKRALFLLPSLRGRYRFRAVSLAQEAICEMTERSDGTGCIYFGSRPVGQHGTEGVGRGVTPVPVFESIPAVRQVHQMISKKG